MERKIVQDLQYWEAELKRDRHIKELGGDVSGYRIPPEMPDDYMANDRLIKGHAVPHVNEQLTLFEGA